MRKLIANLLVFCLVAGMLPAAFSVTATAADAAEKTFLLLNCDDKNEIEAKSLVAEKKIVKNAKFSAKWTIGQKVNLGLNNLTDITPYTTLSFWAYGDSKKPVTMLLRFLSNDPATDGDDYYSFKNIIIQEDGWTQYTFNLANLKTDRTPVGKDKIQNVILFTDGWGMKTDPEAVIYLDSIVLSDKAPEPAPGVSFSPTPAPSPVLDTFGEGIALQVGNQTAYAHKNLTKIDVAPMIRDDRTLVPVRFISEGLGAKVEWDPDARKADINLLGKSISLTADSKEIVINGQSSELDVPAQIIDNRTMIPLRAMVEAVGKKVTWDNRGLILIGDTEYNAVSDSRIIDSMLGYLKNGGITTYNQAPRLTPEVLEWAFSQRPVYFNTSSNPGYGTQENAGSMALFYLSLAAYVDPETKSEKGVLAKDRALEHLRSLISGGREPMCDNGPYWAHASVTNGITMAKFSPAVWSELTKEEVEKLDLLMKSLAISVNWGFNDENTYKSGLGMTGNFEKGWNPNYRCSYIPGIINISLYFGGADTVNNVFTSFNYDSYMKELEAAGFTNIIKVWSVAGKNLMEKGGSATLKSGGDAGSGKGVKMPFVYNGMPLSNIYGIYDHLIKYTYGGTVKNSLGTKGTDNYSYIMNNGSSPFLGQSGMMLEFDSSDANGIRSDAGYCHSSFAVLMPSYTILKMFGGWDGSTDLQKNDDKLIYVGTEDFIYKITQGYKGYSKGAQVEHHEYSFKDTGYLVAKEVWRKIINFAGEPTTMVANPNTVEVPKLPELEQAPPKDGITAPPAGALISHLYEGAFPKAGIYSLGKAYKGKVTTEFDLVFSHDLDEAFNGVIAYAAKDTTDIKFATANMLIQFMGGTINIRNGAAYSNSPVQFAPNYRYHFRMETDVNKKTYSVWVTPTYPTAGAEVQIAKDYAYRANAAEIDNIGVIALEYESENGLFWIENHKTNGDLLAK